MGFHNNAFSHRFWASARSERDHLPHSPRFPRHIPPLLHSLPPPPPSPPAPHPTPTTGPPRTPHPRPSGGAGCPITADTRTTAQLAAEAAGPPTRSDRPSNHAANHPEAHNAQKPPYLTRLPHPRAGSHPTICCEKVSAKRATWRKSTVPAAARPHTTPASTLPSVHPAAASPLPTRGAQPRRTLLPSHLAFPAVYCGGRRLPALLLPRFRLRHCAVDRGQK